MLVLSTKVHLSGRNELLKDEMNVLTLFYYPLMNQNAFYLYLNLLCLNGLKIVTSYDFISKICHLNQDEIEEAKSYLEKLQLLKTYFYQGNHHLVLLAPKQLPEFLKDDLLARYCLQKLGVDLYHELIAYFQLKPEVVLGQEISESFDLSMLKNYSAQSENDFQHVMKSSISSGFNQQLFLQLASEIMFPKHLRTSDNLAVIEEMAVRYSLPMRELIKKVAAAITKENTFDIEYFKRSMSELMIELPKNQSDPIKWRSEQFLQAKQPGIPLLESDLIILKLLREKYDFQDEVINVIVNYALQSSNNQLNKNYIEKIATSFKRSHVTDASSALAMLNYQKPTSKKSPSIKKVVYEKVSDEKADPKLIEELMKKLKKGD